ncbi:MAG: hypothetical protein ACLTTH_12780 [Holdemanella porci]
MTFSQHIKERQHQTTRTLWCRYVFLPRNKLLLNQHKKMFEKLVKQEGCTFITWRKVPCDDSIPRSKSQRLYA